MVLTLGGGDHGGGGAVQDARGLELRDSCLVFITGELALSGLNNPGGHTKKRWNFLGNAFTEFGLRALDRAFASGLVASVCGLTDDDGEALDLESRGVDIHNRVSGDSNVGLVALEIEHNTKLCKLSFYTDEYAAYAGKPPHLLDASSSSTSDKLDLSGARLGAAGTVLVAKMIARYSNLTALDLSKSELMGVSDDQVADLTGIRVLAQALSDSKSSLGQSGTLRSLNIAGVALTEEASHVLAIAIASCTSISELIIGDTCAAVHARVSICDKAIRVTGLGAAGMALLCAFMPRCSELAKLDLSEIEMINGIVSMLVRMLQADKFDKLESLIMRSSAELDTELVNQLQHQCSSKSASLSFVQVDHQQHRQLG
jgi:hypothetical protein